MRGIFKSGLRAFAVGTLFALGISSVMLANGAAISLFTGPGGSNPANQPNLVADLNTLINNINAQILSYIGFTGNGANEIGEIYMSSGQGIVANGTIATAMSSLGPSGSHTTVQEWLLIINSAGVPRYAPLF